MFKFFIFKTILVAMGVYIASVSSAPTNTQTCTEPTDLQTRYNTLNNGQDYRTLFFTSGWKQETLEDDFGKLVYAGIDNTETECPSSFLRGDFPLMLRSPCPWYLEKSLDEERYPKKLYHAVSKCTDCIGSNGLQQCERIYHRIKTLKRSGCNNGVYQYEENNEFIPIAFVCAQKREVENSVAVPTPPAEDDGPPPM